MYKELALRLNLEYSEIKHSFIKIPHLVGNWKKNQIEIYERIVGAGKNQTIYTHAKFYNSPHNFQFRIGKEHFFSKMGKVIGFKDIEFDNLELDKKFLFKSKDEGQFRTVMNYKVLHDLEGIEKSLAGHIENKDGILMYTVVGTMNSKEKIAAFEKVLMFMSRLTNG